MLHHGAGYTRLHLTDGVLAGWETAYSNANTNYIMLSYPGLLYVFA